MSRRRGLPSATRSEGRACTDGGRRRPNRLRRDPRHSCRGGQRLAGTPDEERHLAIRRLDGASCDEVADGLALSLSVAGAPEERPRQEPAATTVATPSEPSPAAKLSPDADVGPGTPPAAPVDDLRTRMAIGVEGAVLSGQRPPCCPARPSSSTSRPPPAGFSRAMFRAAAFGYTAGFSTTVRDYHVWLAGGRMEGCPTWLGSESSVRVRPCVAVDVGTLQTAGSGVDGRSAGALWASASFGAQLDFRVTRVFGVEGGVEAAFPFTRYEIARGTA